MMVEFNIIKYLSGLLGGFVFDRATLEGIALERGVAEVTDFAELDAETKELLRADLAYAAYVSPNIWASSSQSHGSYTKSIGAQSLYEAQRKRLYNIFSNIYGKYDEEKLQEIEGSDSNLQWINF